VTTPLLDHDAGFFQAVKDLQVQTLTAQFAIEALAPICNSVAKNVPVQQQHLLFVETIKHNRMTNTHFYPARGCAGWYMMKTGSVPAKATQVSFSRILIPNKDPLDSFDG